MERIGPSAVSAASREKIGRPLPSQLCRQWQTTVTEKCRHYIVAKGVYRPVPIYFNSQDLELDVKQATDFRCEFGFSVGVDLFPN